MQCNHCGNYVDGEKPFCPYCGSPLRTAPVSKPSAPMGPGFYHAQGLDSAPFAPAPTPEPEVIPVAEPEVIPVAEPEILPTAEPAPVMPEPPGYSVPDDVAKQNCPHCGGILPATAKFCHLCGKSTVPVNAVPVTPAPEQPKKGSKTWLIILASALIAIALGVGSYFLARNLFSDSKDTTQSAWQGDPGVNSDKEAIYKQAMDLYSRNEYAAAKDLFEQLGDYRDSEDYVWLCELFMDDGATEGPVDQRLEIVPAELTYEMTQSDVDEFYSLLEQLEKVAIDEEDEEKALELSEQVDAKYEYLDAQYSIAMILYYCDLTDEEASQLYLDVTDIVTEANNGYLKTARRIYQSDSSVKEALFADWTEQEIAQLLAYTDEIMALQQRNSEIEVAYQDLQNDPLMDEKMVPLYIEMVQNNNKIAQIYGYDNYYTYSYELVYSRDYTGEDVAQMRSYVANYVLDAMSGAFDGFSAGMNTLSTSQQTELIALMEGSYLDATKPYIADYLDTLHYGMREDMLSMFNGNILMCDQTDGAREGAFTANLGRERCVCYFGPGYSNTYTIIHELGHYYGCSHTFLEDQPLDLAETQSQGNEWLFTAYLKDQVDPEVYEVLVDYQTYSSMATIVVCMLVDEFEERVYTHPDVASLTGEDLDRIMEDVCESYGGIYTVESLTTDIQNYWRNVVVESPVYYISYAVSSVAAMDLFQFADADYDKGVSIYERLNENVDLEQLFLGNITGAGLRGPFDETVYENLYYRYGIE